MNPTLFGMISGAIWIAAIAAFIVITMKTGLLYSWLAVVAAIVAQLLTHARFLAKAP
jgi:hypothetical protein